MSEKKSTDDRKESAGISLAGLIFSLVGLASVLLPVWKVFAILCASAGLLTSIFSFFRAKKTGAKTGRAVAGILLGVLALYVAIMVMVLKHVDIPSSDNSDFVRRKDSIERNNLRDNSN